MAGKKGRSGGKHEGDQGGRPTKFNRELAQEILDGIASGATLRQVARKANLNQETIMSWVRGGATGENGLIWFSEHWAKAMEVRAEIKAFEIEDIADDGSNDWYLKESKNGEDGGWPAFDQEHYQRSKLRVETRKWILSKLMPKKYGDKLQHTGEEGGAIQINVNIAEKK
jgi:hypothetical protein